MECRTKGTRVGSADFLSPWGLMGQIKLVGSVLVLMELVKGQLKQGSHRQKNGNGKGTGKPYYIGKGEHFILDQVSPGNFQIVLYHVVFFKKG
jgi:hypothetical protein